MNNKKQFCYILILVLLSIISVELKSQEYYTVKQESSGTYVYEDASNLINIEQYKLAPNCSSSYPDIQNNKASILYKNETVKVYEIKGDWAKVKVLNGVYEQVWGWVNKDELIYKTEKEIDYKSDFLKFYNNNTMLFWEIIVGFLIFISILIFIGRLLTRCKECGKWGAIKLVSRNEKLKNAVSTTIEKSEQLTDIYGKKHTNYYHVPATKKTYDHLDKYKCKFCGNKTEKDYTTSDTKAD